MTTGKPQFVPGGISRRTTLGLMSAGAVAALTGCSAGKEAAQGDGPWLATPEQIEAERMLLEIEADPAVAAIKDKLRVTLSAEARAQMPDAAKTLDESLDQWTRSLIFAELVHRPTQPVFLWATDDTPREWLGHKLGGVGTSGDNPDAIYRMAGIEGGGRYEILGEYHPDGRPAQFLLEVDAGDMAQPQNIMPVTDGKHADIHNTSIMSDRELVVNDDGTFRITLGGEADGPNHMDIPPSGYCMAGVRDILGSWTDKAPKLTLRRLDEVEPEPWTLETVRERVLADMEGYIGFWSHFPDIWFGGLGPNERSEPQGRPGGWGFVCGMNFHLAPDEVFLINTVQGDARYTGFQINNPWMIAPDARKKQVCLNSSQVTANPDGSFTYVIAREDPGVANWLDTDGMLDGIGILRWQAVPPEMTNEGLIRDFRVIKRSELDAMADIPRVTPEERKAQVEARWAAYSSRTL